MLNRPVAHSNTVVDEGAVVVEVRDAAVTDAAVLGPEWPQAATRVAQSGQHNVTPLPLVVVRNLTTYTYSTKYSRSHFSSSYYSKFLQCFYVGMITSIMFLTRTGLENKYCGGLQRGSKEFKDSPRKMQLKLCLGFVN